MLPNQSQTVRSRQRDAGQQPDRHDGRGENQPHPVMPQKLEGLRAQESQAKSGKDRNAHQPDPGAGEPPRQQADQRAGGDGSQEQQVVTAVVERRPLEKVDQVVVGKAAADAKVHRIGVGGAEARIEGKGDVEERHRRAADDRRCDQRTQPLRPRQPGRVQLPEQEGRSQRDPRRVIVGKQAGGKEE
jgi:hypothetical protein